MKTIISILTLALIAAGCESGAKNAVEDAASVSVAPSASTSTSASVEDAASEVTVSVASSASVIATPVDGGLAVPDVDASKKDASSKK